MRSTESGARKSNLVGLRTTAAVLIAFGATFSVTGCSVPNPSNGADGKAFVTQQLTSLKPDWNASTFSAALDPRVNKKLVDGAFKQYASALGPIKDIATVETGKFTANAGIGVPDYVGEYITTLTCKNGVAKTSVVAEHLNGKWMVQSFNLNSKVFENVGKKESKGALAFADSFIQKWSANGFTPKMLYENASPELVEQLHKNELATNLLCTGLQKMGKLKKTSGARLGQVSPAESGYSFKIVTGVNFEKTDANFLLSVVQDGSKWKVQSLNVNSKN